MSIRGLVDGRARLAAEYLEGLCRAICRGIIKLRMEKNRGVRVAAERPSNLSSPSARAVGGQIDVEGFHEKEECMIHARPLFILTRAGQGRDVSEATACDDLTGMRLKCGQGN